MIVDMYDGKNDLTRQVADWKARAEAAEARVRELEARLTVTDEMVERAAKAIAKTFLVSSDSDEVWMMGSGTHCVEFSGLIDPLPLARAALTAALEGKDE